MGSAITTSSKFTSFLGVKGGVGCSTLTVLIARLTAKKRNKKIAVIDATPFPYSTLPSYLGISDPLHYLIQLEPYQNHLTDKILENYFSASPEKVTYIPVKQSDETAATFSSVFNLLQKLEPYFDNIFIDLSSFPNDQYLPVIEKSRQILVISSYDPTSLTALRQWEKRLLPFHIKLKEIDFIFNQTNQAQQAPKDISTWSKHFTHCGNVSFLGEDLAINLIETALISPAIEKNLIIISDKIEKKTAAARFAELHNQNNIENSSKEVSLNPTFSVSLELVNELHQKLLESLRQSGVLKDQKKNEVLQRQLLEPNARQILDQLIQKMSLPNREMSQKLVTETLNLAFGFGPLEPLLQNEEITEIMVNGPEQVYVEKKGLLEKTTTRFLNDQQLRTVIERILAPIGRRIDESQPYVDGRLPDGSRVNAVIPPLSLNGPLLTIRKFSKRKLTVADLIKFGSLTHEAADFLGACVHAKKNIVVSGGTGSGKTTLLNILSNFIPANERVVTIEDSAELQLSQDHVVRLESRPANLEGKGQIAIRDLVINALRMRPDRIVVGECRGGEALDMLQAMNTGHDGSLTTAHANTPRDVVSRLETMCLFTGLELPLKAIREQISRAVHLVVQQNRLPNGKRSVTQISQIQGMEGDVIIIQDIFSFEEGKGLVRKPFAPSFIEDLNSIGYKWPGRSEN